MSMEEKLKKILSQEHQQLTSEQQQFLLDFIKHQQLNILVVGATGAGKSSTINALFDVRHAKVGLGADPMTMDVTRYDFGNLVLWDTPGLGDGLEEDQRHKHKIIQQLNARDDKDNLVIDLVLVILDGSSRDMGTSFELINNIIIPNLGSNPEKRILVAINQADIAYKGAGGWNPVTNTPTEIGYQFLDGKVRNVRQRIQDSTGVCIEPIYYCAGYQGTENPNLPFNLSKLLYSIIEQAPTGKRLALRSNLAQERERWKPSDGRRDYGAEIKESLSFGRVIGFLLGGLFGFFG